ncbi:MAG: ribosomal protein S18-alanine N-acetyltransferase [Eubacteriales bacterium]
MEANKDVKIFSLPEYDGEEVSDEDIRALANIESACFSSPWKESSFRDSLKNRNTVWRFFLAKDKNGAVGYGGVYSVIDEAFITNIAVMPEFRRRKIASLLLECIISYCKRYAVKRLMLEVRISNDAAISLYRKFGFTVDGISKNHYFAPTEDAYLMSLTITDTL